MDSLSTENTNRDNFDFLDKFFNNLSQSDFKPAHNALWTVDFHGATGPGAGIRSNNASNDSYVFFVNLAMAIKNDIQTNFIDRDLSVSRTIAPGTVSARTNLTRSCLYAASVTVPAETTDTVSAMSIPGSGGIVSPLLLNNRVKPNNLEISFIENNASFADIIIRPWITACSRAGLVKIMSENKLNSNIVVEFIQPGVRALNDSFEAIDKAPPKIRKRFVFKNCVPVSVNGQVYSYRDSGLVLRTVSFLYSSVVVGNSLDYYNR